MKVVGVCGLFLPFLLVLMDTPITSQSPVPGDWEVCGYVPCGTFIGYVGDRTCYECWWEPEPEPDCSGFPGDEDCHGDDGPSYAARARGK